MLFNAFEKKEEADPLNYFIGNHSAYFISSQNDYLSKHLKNVNKHDVIHFNSNGRFALHDIVIYYAAKLNGAHVLVSSFNLSQEAAGKFVRAWDFGKFKSLRFILNLQKKSNFIKALRIIEGKFPIKFTNIHAKVALIWNDDEYITVVTSGNLSSNNNIERGMIFFDKSTFDFDYKWMTDVFEK